MKKQINTIKVGNVVQLKVGGPLMTVRELGDDGLVYCNWFDGNEILGWKDLKTSIFQKDSLFFIRD